MTEEKTGNLEQIRKGLTEWLKTRWTDAAELEVSELRKPAMGSSNETLLFDVRWREKGKSHTQAMVARLGISSGPQLFQVYDLAKQYRIVELLGSTGVPVPRLYGYEEDEIILGAPFYVMERLEGRALSSNPPYHKEGWLTDCTTEERTQMWKSGIEAMVKIHKLDWKASGFGFLNRPAVYN